jgi:transposase
MAGERLSMRPIRRILRGKWVEGRSHRELGRALSVSVGVISSTLSRAKRAGLDWSAVERLSDAELEARLYCGASPGGALARGLPDFSEVHAERQRRGVTLALLHVEYLEANPTGYGYTQFCEYYRRWSKKRRVSMRQVHRAGEKLFVDYSGKKPRIYDTGREGREVELFVGTLGASSFVYAEATQTQKSVDFISSHTRMLEKLGGAPLVIVPDQLKSGVIRACRYEPGLQRTYAEWSEHYGTTVIPARPRKPRDKAKVEVSVQVAQRWILARIRNERHRSLASLNARIFELCAELNERPMRAYGQSRRERFEALDRPALRPLPAQRFAYVEWKQARVNIDYHIEVGHHYYSVPHNLLHEQVEVRVDYSAATIEVYYRGSRVASHGRNVRRGGHTTDPRHMPRAHQKHLEWSPSRLIDWSAKIGPETRSLVSEILTERTHPEQGYRSCLGILRLVKRDGVERVEAACARARAGKARSYRSVDAILRRGLDRIPLPEIQGFPRSTPMRVDHENVRGTAYYTAAVPQPKENDQC